MKANEAPEKIYRRLEGTYIKYYDYKPAKIRYNEKEPTEYIRTDTFIEKACDWLEDHIYEYLKTNKTWNEADYDPQLIGDLRNYIKYEKTI